MVQDKDSNSNIEDLILDTGSCINEFQDDDKLDSMSSSEIEWHCKFKKFFKEQESIDYLKSCNCFDNKDWKKNFKTLLNKRLNSDCEGYKKLFDLFTVSSKNKLQFLAVHDMILTQVPLNIGTMKESLYSLSLNNIDVHHLPNEIGELVNLSQLIIKNIPIYELPNTLSNLENLQYLLVSNTLITDVSNIKWNQMKELTNLLLPKNKIIKPILDLESKLNLRKLERIDLSGNTGISELPNLSSECKLKILQIDNTGITFLQKEYIYHLGSLFWRNSGFEIKINEMTSSLIERNNDPNQNYNLFWYHFGSKLNQSIPETKFIIVK